MNPDVELYINNNGRISENSFKINLNSLGIFLDIGAYDNVNAVL